MGKAEDHVDWWLSSIRQPLIDNFNHGYKHGVDDAKTPQDEQNAPVAARTGENAYHISTTEDIQRGWAENEKTRVYEDG
jgi:hypothetical protein